MDFAKHASAPTTTTMPESVVNFVTAAFEAKVRLSYGALATIYAEATGKAIAQSMRGRRGAQLATKLPPAVQPAICRTRSTARAEGAKAGSEVPLWYHDKALRSWDENGIEYDLAQLGAMDVIEVEEKALAAFQEFCESAE